MAIWGTGWFDPIKLSTTESGGGDEMLRVQPIVLDPGTGPDQPPPPGIGEVPIPQLPMPMPPPRPIQCQANIIDAMINAWIRVANGTANKEAGFIVYSRSDGSMGTVNLPNTNEFKQVKFNIQDLIPAGATAVAIFHTHPNSAGENPSRGDAPSDEATANSTGLSIYVISSRGPSVYDPKTKQTTKLRDNIDWQKKCK